MQVLLAGFYCIAVYWGAGKVHASLLENANFYILRSILGWDKNTLYQELLGIMIMKTLEHRRTCILHLCFINPYSAIIPSSFINFLVKKIKKRKLCSWF